MFGSLSHSQLTEDACESNREYIQVYSAEIEFAFSKTNENWSLPQRAEVMQTLETSLLGIQFFPNGMIVCKDSGAARSCSTGTEFRRSTGISPMPSVSFSLSACLSVLCVRRGSQCPFGCLLPRVRPPGHGNREWRRAVFWVLCVWIILSCLTFSRANTCPYVCALREHYY